MAARQYDSGSGRPRAGKGAVVPSDLRRALEADAAAGVAFEELPPSHRRAYVEWVEDAKGSAARARRIAGTVERLREGEPESTTGSDPTGLTP